MWFINNYEKKLQVIVQFVEIFSYTLAVIIVILSLIYAIFLFGKNISNLNNSFINIRLELGEAIGLALSFILATEVLKIFYIKTYKQLVIIVSLTLLKIIISYFLMSEINDIKNKQKK
jgi:uncharacterized membrane protein